MNEELVIRKLIEIDEKINEVLPTVRKLDLASERAQETLDHHTGMLERLDQERLSQHARSDRLEVRVERLEKHTGLA